MDYRLSKFNFDLIDIFFLFFYILKIIFEINKNYFLIIIFIFFPYYFNIYFIRILLLILNNNIFEIMILDLIKKNNYIFEILN